MGVVVVGTTKFIVGTSLWASSVTVIVVIMVVAVIAVEANILLLALPVITTVGNTSILDTTNPTVYFVICDDGFNVYSVNKEGIANDVVVTIALVTVDPNCVSQRYWCGYCYEDP